MNGLQHLYLTAVDEELVEAWKRHCGHLPFVTVYRGSILDLDVDAIVSPANSFGFMDGGIDALYLQNFGKELQDRVRDRIARFHQGELLVGEATYVPLDSDHEPGVKKRMLLVAPTMRVPMILPKDTVNPYLAARAVLKSAGFVSRSQYRDATIAMPGLGTGIGQVSPDMCARQVLAAINAFCKGFSRVPDTCVKAMMNHQDLTGQPYRDLQRPEGYVYERPVRV